MNDVNTQYFKIYCKIACQFEIGSNELDVGNKVVAQRRAAAAFKTHREGMIIVRGINHLLGRCNCTKVILRPVTF